MAKQRRNSLPEQYEQRRDAYTAFCEMLERLLIDLMKQAQLNYHSISHRAKDPESLRGKLIRKQGKYADLSEITDLAGVRIITYYSDQVYAIADLIEREFCVDAENTIDKGKALDPDRFGYLSLHYVVELSADRCALSEYRRFQSMKAELQIRSILQHTWAEIEHDLGYKARQEIPREIQRDFSRLAGLLELADREFVAIRSRLTGYEQKVSREIKRDDSELGIDRISLQAFLDTDPVIQQLNRQIAEDQNRKLKQDDSSSLNYIIGNLRWVGFTGINEIRNSIDQHYELILAMAEAVCGGSETSRDGISFHEDVGLFYLCYAVVAFSNSKEYIEKYLIENHIMDYEPEEEVEEFILLLQTACQEYLAKHATG